MIHVYNLRADGVYVPIRYYQHNNGTNVVLIGMLHVGEEIFYKQVDRTLKKCDMVIYEEPFTRDKDTMKQLDEVWKQLLHQEDLDEAFLAAIYLPMPPQKFIQDHGLQEESHGFDFSRANWISGDGAWRDQERDGSLSAQTWSEIRKIIGTMDIKLKEKKVFEAKFFLEKVNAGSASMFDYISFRNLYEEEIESTIHQSTIMDVRNELTFDVFDDMVCIKKSSLIGIKFGNGHLPGINQLLYNRGYRCTAVRWLRALTY